MAEQGESSVIRRFFSPIIKYELISFSDGYSQFRLRNNSIIAGSESVTHQDSLLQSGLDYKMDYTEGVIYFLKEFSHTAEIQYSIIPKHLTRNLYYFIPQNDTLKTALPDLVQRKNIFSFPETRINIAGSKSIAISVASDDDFSIDQTLFLAIDGELSKNLFLKAQLTDSQSPLTPEGDSRELSSLDQIFIKIYGRQYEIMFGDMDIRYQNTEFINYYNKIEGVKAAWFGKHSIRGAVAISKGKQAVFSFNGQTAKQGPYYLLVEGGNVQLIPATDEVYLNGVLMLRGNDYTIDYAEGSITFTSRHFIDSSNLIYVRFQYSDEEFRKYKYLADSEINLLPGLQLRTHLIVENDDSKNPLVGELTSEEKEILKQAGDGPAWIDGVIVADDGNYVVEYTETGEAYYRFVGTDTEGNYHITFTNVGTGNGSYIQSAPYQFEFVGTGNGNWIPMRLLPAPEHLANYDMSLDWEKYIFSLKGEGILSVYDKNKFSTLDNSDNFGYGSFSQIMINPDFDLINPYLRVYYRYLSKYLKTFGDTANPLDNYELNELSSAELSAVTEISSQFNLVVRNIASSSLSYTLNDHIQKRQSMQAQLSALQQKFLPALTYTHHNTRVSQSNSEISSNRVRSSYAFYPLQFDAAYFNRNYKTGLDTLKTTSKQITQELGLSSFRTKNIAAKVALIKEINESSHQNSKRDAVTISSETLVELAGQNIRTNYAHRQTQDETGKQTYDMAEISLTNSLLNRAVNMRSNYSLKNLEFYPKIRELVFVGSYAGIYDSLGVITEDGEYDYAMVQKGDPEMAIELNSDFTLNLNPKLITSQTENHSLLTDFLSKIQTESYLLLSENSRAKQKWELYLLNPNYLMNNETSIYSRIMQRHTVWYDLLPRKMLTKALYQKDETLDNRYQEDFRSNLLRRELMLRINNVLKSDLELNYENRKEKGSRYNSDISSNRFSFDLRFSNLSSLFFYEEENGKDTVNERNYKLTSIGITESINYFYLSKYRLLARLEYRHNKRSGSDFLNFLPEKRAGNSLKWNLRLNYQVNHYTSLEAEYSGNNFPLQNSVHKVKVELRAEF